MKIRINYKEYKYSEAASMWSRIGGYITAYGFFVMILLGFIINAILKAILPGKDSIILTIILAFISLIGIVVFCSHMEKKCLKRDMPKAPSTSGLTDDQKRELIEKLLEHRKSQ